MAIKQKKIENKKEAGTQKCLLPININVGAFSVVTVVFHILFSFFFVVEGGFEKCAVVIFI